MVNFIMKLPLEFRFSLNNTPKNAKNIAFRKNKNLFYLLDLVTFWF